MSSFDTVTKGAVPPSEKPSLLGAGRRPLTPTMVAQDGVLESPENLPDGFKHPSGLSDLERAPTTKSGLQTVPVHVRHAIEDIARTRSRELGRPVTLKEVILDAVQSHYGIDIRPIDKQDGRGEIMKRASRERGAP